jgi:hypothetical protein
VITLSDQRRLKGQVSDFVRIIYFDEAGTSDVREEPILVTTAVIIRDKYWLPIERDAQQIVDSIVPDTLRRDFEFHAGELFSGNAKGFQRNARDKAIRFEILRSFLGIVKKFKLPIIYVAHDKRELPIKGAQEMAAHLQIGRQICAAYVENWLVQKTKGRDVGMLISDVRSSDNKTEEKLIKHYLMRSRKWPMFATVGPILEHVIDTIHFADSKESIGLQVADACAYVIKRHLMNPADTDAEPLYKIINPLLFATVMMDGGKSDPHPESGRQKVRPMKRRPSA